VIVLGSGAAGRVAACAVGNGAAGLFGTAPAAGGATIGPALVLGTGADEAAAHD